MEDSRTNQPFRNKSASEGDVRVRDAGFRWQPKAVAEAEAEAQQQQDQRV